MSVLPAHWSARRDRLGAMIEAARPLWKPQPFVVGTPAWSEGYSGLCQELLALDDGEVERLAADELALRERLAIHLPDLRAIADLTDLPPAPVASLVDPGPHFDWAIPGRKREQIEAFCSAVGAPAAEIVDWCAGKGHLGRFCAAQWGIAVTALEHDATLVGAALDLALRARQGAQRARQIDVLAENGALEGLLRGRHVLALHACGRLHRALVAAAIAAPVAALDLSPCCYGRHMGPHEAFLGAADASPQLVFDAADLRLAVTGEATAPAREIALRRRGAKWKLGFTELLCAGGDWAYRALCAVPTDFLRGDFAAYCRRLAEREGVALPQAPDFAAAEAAGEARWRRAERFGLVRLAYRRALEVWLVFDLASRLERAGYAVRVSTFCAATLTPRNLLVSARRE